MINGGILLAIIMLTPGVLADRQPYSPTEILGPAIAGGMGEAMLQGMLLTELSYFYCHSPKSRLLRFIVYWINIVALAQTGVAGYSCWNVFVDNFANSSVLYGFTWSSQIPPILTSLMSGPVHGYFIYRCWMSSHRNWFLTISLGLGAALSMISAFLTTIGTFVFTSNNFVSTELSRRLSPMLNVWLVSTAAVDMGITAILLTYLIRSRYRTHSRYLATFIDRLVGLVWQSACPPCICAITACVVSASATLRGTRTYWFLLPEAFLGKLYCVSLMITLNHRVSLTQQLEVTDPHAPTSIPGVVFDLRTGFDKPDLAVASEWSNTDTRMDHMQMEDTSGSVSNSKPTVLDLEQEHDRNGCVE